MNKNCKQCSKQYTCNKEKCEPVLWHNTKRLWNTRKDKVNGKLRYKYILGKNNY